jgi:hypothetical protein
MLKQVEWATAVRWHAVTVRQCPQWIKIASVTALAATSLGRAVIPNVVGMVGQLHGDGLKLLVHMLEEKLAFRSAQMVCQGMVASRNETLTHHDLQPTGVREQVEVGGMQMTGTPKGRHLAMQ